MTVLADLPEILTVEDVADWLHVSPSSVRRAAAQGQLPGVRIGSLWRFHRDTLARTIGADA